MGRMKKRKKIRNGFLPFEASIPTSQSKRRELSGKLTTYKICNEEKGEKKKRKRKVIKKSRFEIISKQREPFRMFKKDTLEIQRNNSVCGEGEGGVRRRKILEIQKKKKEKEKEKEKELDSFQFGRKRRPFMIRERERKKFFVSNKFV